MTANEERNLVRRINRQLAREGQQLRKNRGGNSADRELGDWYIQERQTNQITATHCDPETWLHPTQPNPGD